MSFFCDDTGCQNLGPVQAQGFDTTVPTLRLHRQPRQPRSSQAFVLGRPAANKKTEVNRPEHPSGTSAAVCLQTMPLTLLEVLSC